MIPPPFTKTEWPAVRDEFLAGGIADPSRLDEYVTDYANKLMRENMPKLVTYLHAVGLEPEMQNIGNIKPIADAYIARIDANKPALCDIEAGMAIVSMLYAIASGGAPLLKFKLLGNCYRYQFDHFMVNFLQNYFGLEPLPTQSRTLVVATKK